tara:strand:+ start:133 stop:957 length:825 start_codon:yes stop_codon:yes gene_type:complete
MSIIPPIDNGTLGEKFERLVEIMRILRSPDGCPWDREQTPQSLRPFILEEAYELVEAIDVSDISSLRSELGDYIFEAVFLAQICSEENAFRIEDSIDCVCEKLIRRHPHVFDSDISEEAITSQDVKKKWEEIKNNEKQAAGETPHLLSGIPKVLPALLRAYRMGKRTSTIGFDWPITSQVIDKVEEELSELRTAIEADKSSEIEEELGDLLFTVANLSRHLGLDPEQALNKANIKFTKRFNELENYFRENQKELRDVSDKDMEIAWEKIKKELM